MEPASTVTGSASQYPWGSRGSDSSDPEAVLSGTNWDQQPGDEGVCKTLPGVAREETWETGATEPRKEVVTADTIAAGPEATTVENPGAADRGETLRYGRAIRIPTDPAAAERRPTTAELSPLQQPEGQEAENHRTQPRSGESVAIPGMKTRV
ncbi:hypothetical protein NDU88_007759 [Pleurodeles waltl]|uniref:Uncharacterized protein n=1 Tax=Pleurodeles waltl TaxID=8319 RepID=A0AAV7QLM1_PLEWA|nr:hypothetical protein NDU88_007759 [Pleurodeles waltl]